MTLGSELREVLDGLYCGGMILKEGCVLELDDLAGEERARARAASLFVGDDAGDVGRLELSLSLSCRTLDGDLTNFEKKPGAIPFIQDTSGLRGQYLRAWAKRLCRRVASPRVLPRVLAPVCHPWSHRLSNDDDADGPASSLRCRV